MSQATSLLRAGAARVTITPTAPVTLAGYGSRKDVSRGIHDPLSARALALEEDGRRLVLVSTDSLGFYGGTAARFRRAILEATGLAPSELFLAAIHTHSAPDVASDHPNNVRYVKTLEANLVGVVRRALARLAPVRMGIGIGASPVGANRREVVPDAGGKTRIVLGRNPSLMTDREVQVVKIARADTGGLVCVLFDYATHSTSLGPRNYLVSGDVHGLAEQFLERRIGGGVTAPAFAGASGDIDPWFRIRPGFDTRRGWVPEPILLGTMLGEEVAHVLDRIEEAEAAGPIRTAFETLRLPGRPHGKGKAARPDDGVEFNLTVGRAGDVAFVGLGGEVFNEIGRAIKEASPFPHTLVITHCNGAAGYLPTAPSYAEGGYEPESSAFAPTAARKVVRAAVRLLRQVRRA